MNLKIQRFLTEKGSRWIFPLSFVFSALVNVIFFYSGFGFSENPIREYGFIILNVGFALFCGVTLLAVLRTHRLTVKTWILLGSVMVFYAIGFGVAFFRYGFSAPYYSTFLKHFVFFGIPAFFAGGCGAIMHREKSFLEIIDLLSWVVLPAALMYMNGSLVFGLPREWNYGFSLGILNYMNLAYLFFPYVLSHTLGIVSEAPLKKPFSQETFKRSQLVRVIILMILWGAILASGTRGVLLSVCIASIFVVVFQLLHRNFKVSSVLPLMLSGVLMFNLFVYAPSGFRRLSKFDMVIEGLSQGKLVTTENESEEIAENIDDLVSIEIPTTKPEEPTTAPEEPTTTPEEPTTEPEEPIDLNVQIGNRGTMFKLAWKEFLKNPLTGMGPFGYEVKYNQYPHSVLFELIAETGLLGSIYFLGLLLLVVVTLLKDAWKKPEIRNIIVFLLCYAILANVDAGLWDCSAVLFALGYGITYGDKHVYKEE